MSKVAVGIVLKYTYEYHELSRIILDLYLFYNHIFCKQADRTYIITDIYEDEDMIKIIAGVKAGLVDGSALNLIKTIKDKGHYISYQSQEYWLYHKLDQIINYDVKELFFYFSGHGEPGNFVLPNNDRLLHYQLQELILRKICNPDQSALFIFDCCHGVDINLGFKYNGEQKYWQSMSDTKNTSRANILIFSSCEEGELSEVNPTGSAFTQHLLLSINRQSQRLLRTNLHSLYEHLRKQTKKSCQFYSNNQLNREIPNWLLKYKFNIKKDRFHKLILIEYEHK